MADQMKGTPTFNKMTDFELTQFRKAAGQWV